MTEHVRVRVNACKCVTVCGGVRMCDWEFEGVSMRTCNYVNLCECVCLCGNVKSCENM